MQYLIQLTTEAIFVGILLVLIGSITGYTFSKFYPRPKMSKECGNYNKYFIMEATLFMTGFFLHLFCEAIGLNFWYSNNSAAKLVKYQI